MPSLKSLAQKVRATSEWADENPNMDDPSPGMSHYKVRLRYKGRALTVPFSMGSALTREPEAEDVLDCLLSDVSGFENARDFEDWCGEYGYDTDSRKAERTFRIIEKQAARLRSFLGDDYETFQQAER